MSKHTPGPYFREERFVYALDGGVNRVSIRVEAGRFDGAATSNAELVATAMLFQAAPELLAACERAMDAVPGLEWWWGANATNELRAMLHAAIAKARGDK
jgi:hypothetical protein